MKKPLILALLMLPMAVLAQEVDDSCKILRDYYQSVIDEPYTGELPNLARVLTADLPKLKQMNNPSLFIVSNHLRTLQDNLDEHYKYYKEGEVWYLQFHSEPREMDWIRKECPTINLKPLEDEIAFYNAKFKPKDQVKDAGAYKRQGAVPK